MIEKILIAFPKLKDDNHFKITSKQDTRYNCIAWAAFYTDRWLWPPGGYLLDGVHYYWPSEIDKNDRIETFKAVFQLFEYVECENSEFEENYRKIALYQNAQGHCTHAARQKRNGIWTSKLGEEQDIEHGTPHTIECEMYGTVEFIMKKKLD